jgi:hypothetical protein
VSIPSGMRFNLFRGLSGNRLNCLVMGLRLHHCFEVGYLTGSLALRDEYHKFYFAVNIFTVRVESFRNRG